MFLTNRGPKRSFIGIIRLWVITSLLFLAAILLITHTIKNNHEAESRAERTRTHYIEDQRKTIEREVEQVVRVIDYEIAKSLRDAKVTLKNRVYEADAIARNIYDQYAGSKSDEEIQKIIIDALRPVRFDQGTGYYFVTAMDGTSRLFPVSPEREGTSLLNDVDVRGRHVVRNSIQIAKTKGEGFNLYHWTKPGEGSEEFEKIAFVQHFKPFDWYIGTGVYLDALESAMQDIIAHYVDNHRFGPGGSGYVFINELLNIEGGDEFARVYANPNRPNDTGRLISDEYKDAKGKQFRKEFLKGLREHGACFVDYWYHKLDNDAPSPKTSYFKLAGNGRFIVAAGVYLDEIEQQIQGMRTVLKGQLLRSLFIISAVFSLAILFAISLFHWMSRKLEVDFHVFFDFFKRAADRSELINRRQVRFAELDQLAEFANDMLIKKSEIEDALREEHDRLEHLMAEQKKAQAALRKSEEEYRILVDNAKDAIFIEQAGRLKFWNPVTESMFGYSGDELSGLNIYDIIHPDDAGAVKERNDAWLASGKPSDTYFPFRFIRKKGGIVWTQVSVVRVEWGNQPAVLNFVRDVTEQKELEDKLIQSRKLEAIGTLAGGIAHDFNNILSGLLGYTQLAMYEVEDLPATKKKLNRIYQAGERAADLVRQILSFSRSRQIELRPISPLQLTKEVLRLIRATIPANIEIRQSLNSDSTVLADATNIHQVLMNLCTNAAHAMRKTGGALSVRLQDVSLRHKDLDRHIGVVPGDFLKISVEDTGCGMTKEVQEKAFDPFFTTKGREEGTGMGLAAVHGITAELGGFISLFSEPGQGTSVHVFIPLIPESVEIDRGKDEEPMVGGTERILFVDDEPIQKEIAEDALSHYGYRVTAFTDSTAALAHFNQDPDAYDLVITDMTMPKMTGDMLTQKIHLKRPRMPVVMCTGFSEVMDEKKAVALNISAFLYKPVVIADLVKAIRTVLDRNEIR